jgi:hypothetical protein
LKNDNSINEMIKREGTDEDGDFLICKTCNVKHYKKFAGYTGQDMKDKIWTDKGRRRFNGAMCPQCHSDRINADNKRRRAEKRAKGLVVQAYDSKIG